MCRTTPYCWVCWRTLRPNDILHDSFPLNAVPFVTSVKHPKVRRSAAALLLLSLVSGCAGEKAAEKADSATAMTDHGHMAGMSAPITIPPGARYTEADVHFMQGMIAHHAQAIAMSKLANQNAANPRVKFLATKIDQSQRVEIVQMQNWLLQNAQTAPDTMSHTTMMMAGMLTPAEMKELEDTKGAEFDQKFLVYMIKHHEGAIQMVKDLFATPLAGQEVNVSVFANDVEQVQTAEISAMHQLLADL